MTRALAIVGALVVVAAAVPAAASPEGHAEVWSELDGSGQMTQTCPATGSAAAAAYEISDGVVRVLDEAGGVLSDHALPGSGAWPLAERYELADGTDDGRGVDRVLVREAGAVRMEVLVDRDTSVPLAITSFEGDGDVHCAFALIEWSPGPSSVADGPEATVDDVPLPDTVAGFVLGSAVAGDGFVAGLYGDGVFTFSLALWDGAFEVEGTAGGPFGSTELGPGRSLVSWPVDDQTLVLIGDLPVDVRDAVVAALPEPDVPGFFLRLWRRLFG